MAKAMDVITPRKQKPAEPEYKISTLIKLWWRVLLKIIKQIINRVLHDKKAAAAVLAIVVVLAAAVIFVFGGKSSDPIPKSVHRAVNFPLYYPAKLPEGYKYQKDSAKVQDSIAFFTISKDIKRIQVSEQAAPHKPPDLDALTKVHSIPAGPSGFSPPGVAAFEKIDNPSGQAIQGKSLAGNPVAIVLTDNTLINLSGTPSLPGNVLTQVIKSLHK
jgi:hypothetical protein